MPAALAEHAELCSLQERIGHRFADPALLVEALSHRSWCHERNGRKRSSTPDADQADHTAASNERLEFLGDAVLGLCVSDRTMEQWPHLGPGDLSAVRSAVVSAEALADAARDCDLGSALLLGRGEEATGGADRESILADAFEAVLAAVYLDGGIEAAQGMVGRLLGQYLTAAAAAPGAGEAKNRLQEYVAQRFGTKPTYVVMSSGPPHQRRYTAEARVAEQVWGRGKGPTKRAAERHAAAAACQQITGQHSAGRQIVGQHSAGQHSDQPVVATSNFAKESAHG